MNSWLVSLRYNFRPLNRASGQNLSASNGYDSTLRSNDSLSPHHASYGCRSGQSNRICAVWVRCSFPRLSVLCDSLHIFVLDNTEQASHRRLVRKMIYLMLCRYAGVRALCVFALVQQWRKRATNACLPELSVKFLVSWYGLLLAPSLVPLCCPSHVLHHSAIDRKVFQPPVLN